MARHPVAFSSDWPSGLAGEWRPEGDAQRSRAHFASAANEGHFRSGRILGITAVPRAFGRDDVRGGRARTPYARRDSSPIAGGNPRSMKNANSPTHEEVARRAREIWSARGCPGGCDTEIWQEAERQLAVGSPDSGSTVRDTSRTAGDAKGAFAERVQSETAAESAVEYLISPPVSEEEAVKAALQTQRSDASAPDLPAVIPSGTRKRSSGATGPGD